MVKKQLLLRAVAEMEITTIEGQTEEEVRKEIMEAIANDEPEQGPITGRLQELLMQRKQPEPEEEEETEKTVLPGRSGAVSGAPDEHIM